MRRARERALPRTARSMRPLPGLLRPRPPARRASGRGVSVARRQVALQVAPARELVLGDGCRIGDATRIVVRRAASSSAPA